MADWTVVMYQAADGEKVVLKEIQELSHTAGTAVNPRG